MAATTSSWTLDRLFHNRASEFQGAMEASARFYVEQALGEDDLQGLLTLKGLDEILTSVPLVSPMVRVVKDGQRLPVEFFTIPSSVDSDAVRYVDTLRLYRCLRDGATVVIRDLHRYVPSITALSWGLSQSLGCAVTVNAYLSPHDAQAFRPHFDYHDIIIIQLSGEKDWAEFEENVTLPLDNNNWRVPNESVHPGLTGHATEVTKHRLKPGDVLFVPRGGSHAVKALQTLSLHLTLELQDWTTYDVLNATVQQATAKECLRTAARHLPGAVSNLSHIAIQQCVQTLAEVAKELDHDDVHWALQKVALNDLFESPVDVVRQYEATNGQAPEKWRRRTNLNFSLLERPTGVELRTKDRILKFPIGALQFLELALSGASVDVLSPSGMLGREQIEQVLAVLSREAILFPVGGPQ